eukprot:CAMPEP_0172878496 /NCGR_PEP_ID=MMETSP1075-20121228/109867_1 /TAXON_ID=2916 /ORGANISM="Ceratium fusus, Strain PA161109" /LENGTH=165 /DNA_ID=CAMNT_0013730293 /DNA_START=343 /DNA_END=838 /DNA_ORIENTATION=+
MAIASLGEAPVSPLCTAGLVVLEQSLNNMLERNVDYQRCHPRQESHYQGYVYPAVVEEANLLCWLLHPLQTVIELRLALPTSTVKAAAFEDLLLDLRDICTSYRQRVRKILGLDVTQSISNCEISTTMAPCLLPPANQKVQGPDACGLTVPRFARVGNRLPWIAN